MTHRSREKSAFRNHLQINLTFTAAAASRSFAQSGRPNQPPEAEERSFIVQHSTAQMAPIIKLHTVLGECVNGMIGLSLNARKFCILLLV